MISNNDWRPIDWDGFFRDVVDRRVYHHGETLGGLVHLIRHELERVLRVDVEGNFSLSGSRVKTRHWANCFRAQIGNTPVFFRGANNVTKGRYEVHVLIGQRDYAGQDTANSGTYNGRAPDATWHAMTGVKTVRDFLGRVARKAAKAA